MDIRIKSVQEKGDHTKEYVELEVVNDCEIGDYAIADTTYSDDSKISCRLRHFHWFSNKKVKRGDRVLFYTKKGDSKSSSGLAGSTHHIYWGLGSAVWNNTGDAAVLFYIGNNFSWKKS